MRRTLTVLALLVALLALLGGVWRAFVGAGAVEGLVLSEVSGEVVLTGPEDARIPAVGGQLLAASDRLATGAEGRAVLALGGETRIRVGPGSSVQVVEVREDGVRLELEDGALQATVRPSAGALRVGHRGRDVQATDADFAVAARDGLVILESERGSLMTQGIPGVAAIESGERVVAADGEAWRTEIPTDLLLDVGWPEERRVRTEVADVSGRTAPGAQVRLEGSGQPVVVTADAEGAFAARVALQEGDNPLRVVARDLFGEEREVEVVLVRDSQGPAFRGGVEYRR